VQLKFTVLLLYFSNRLLDSSLRNVWTRREESVVCILAFVYETGRFKPNVVPPEYSVEVCAVVLPELFLNTTWRKIYPICGLNAICSRSWPRRSSQTTSCAAVSTQFYSKSLEETS